MCVCFPTIGWHPAWLYSCLVPSVPGTGSRSTTTLTRITCAEDYEMYSPNQASHFGVAFHTLAGCFGTETLRKSPEYMLVASPEQSQTWAKEEECWDEEGGKKKQGCTSNVLNIATLYLCYNIQFQMWSQSCQLRKMSIKLCALTQSHAVRFCSFSRSSRLIYLDCSESCVVNEYCKVNLHEQFVYVCSCSGGFFSLCTIDTLISLYSHGLNNFYSRSQVYISVLVRICCCLTVSFP